MSYYAVYAVKGQDPVEGNDVATNRGWVEFGDWAERLGLEEWPETCHLAEHEECYPAEGLAGLEGELTRALAEKPGEPSANVLGVAGRLLEILRGRPKGAVGLLVTDGTAPE